MGYRGDEFRLEFEQVGLLDDRPDDETRAEEEDEKEDQDDPEKNILMEWNSRARIPAGIKLELPGKKISLKNVGEDGVGSGRILSL